MLMIYIVLQIKALAIFVSLNPPHVKAMLMLICISVMGCRPWLVLSDQLDI